MASVLQSPFDHYLKNLQVGQLKNLNPDFER